MELQKIDTATTTRKGEELPLEPLQNYLLGNLPRATGKLQVAQFPGGYSNLTYLITLGSREYVLRRPPLGAKVKSGHDMSREFRILSGLRPHYPKVPSPLIYCEDETIIGAPFYVMERIKGVILRYQMPPEMYPREKQMEQIARSWLDTLMELHEVDYEGAGLGDLGRPQGYVGRQISGWGKRYLAAKTDEVPNLERAFKWLETNQPRESDVSLIHNDFKYDNLILDPDDWTRVLAVLDWEMATLGDPLMDLGTSLGYWVNPHDPELMKGMRLNLSFLPGNPTRGEIVHQYALKTGRSIDDPVFYYVYGLIKIAVIIQQIYLRYQKGLTKDPRFATLMEGVTAIGQIAHRAIENKKIDDLF